MYNNYQACQLGSPTFVRLFVCAPHTPTNNTQFYHSIALIFNEIGYQLQISRLEAIQKMALWINLRTPRALLIALN